MDKEGTYVPRMDAVKKGGIPWAAVLTLDKEAGLKLSMVAIIFLEVGHQLVAAEVGLEVMQIPGLGQLAEVGMEVTQMPARGERSEVGMEVAQMPAQGELAQVGMEFQVAQAIKISQEVGGLKVAQACSILQEDQEHQESQEDPLKVIQAFVLIHQLARHIISNHRIIVASALWLALAEHL